MRGFGVKRLVWFEGDPVSVRDLVQERTVELTTGVGHFFEAGSGDPTIFLHGVGFTAGGAEWFGSIKAGLGNAVHVISMDQLGFGAVDRPVQRYEFSHLVDRVRELQDALGFERTNVVGHSLGGWIAGTLAYESPERVNRLVMVANAGLNTAPPPGVQNFEPPTDAVIVEGVAHILDEDVRAELLTERLRNAAVPGAVETHRSVSAMLNDTAMRRRYYLTRRLARIQAETLMVFGEQDLVFPPLEGRDLMQREIPNGRAVVLPDTGHAVTTERPQELATLIGEFLS